MSDTVNVFAKDLRGIVKKDCPFIQGAWIEFFDDITVGTITLAQEAENNNDITKTLELLITQISNWNFADEQNQPLPIAIESLKKLPFKLIKWLSESLFAVMNEGQDSKKKT